MKIYYDESGDFSLTKKRNISLVGSLTCTDSFDEVISYFIEKFEARNNVVDEIKGSQLSIKERMKVCNFIKKNRSNLVITITMVDSSFTTLDDISYFRTRQAGIFRRNKDSFIERGGGESKAILEYYDKITKIAEYSSRLSNEEFLQSLMTITNMKNTLHNSIIYFLDWKYAKDFRTYDYIFDAKLVNKLSPMEKYIKANLKAFIQDIPDINNRIIVLPDTWKSGHPFIDKYMLKEYDLNGVIHPEVIDLNKLFENGLQFKDSKEKHGLKLIDMVCNTVYSYIVNPKNADYRSCYDLLKYSMAHKEGKSISMIDIQKKRFEKMNAVKYV